MLPLLTDSSLVLQARLVVTVVNRLTRGGTKLFGLAPSRRDGRPTPPRGDSRFLAGVIVGPALRLRTLLLEYVMLMIAMPEWGLDRLRVSVDWMNLS